MSLLTKSAKAINRLRPTDFRGIVSSQNQSVKTSIVKSKSVSLVSERVLRALGMAIAGESKLTKKIRDIDGMSGQMYRSFINNLIGLHSDARYLEIGCWAGSTAAAAIYGNEARCLCIDNWSLFGGPKGAFFLNIENVKSEKIKFDFIEKDFREIDYRSIGVFDVYLFDGPHGEQDQYDGIILAQPALDDTYVLIIDDWNWYGVRKGVLRGLAEVGSSLELLIEIRTTDDDTHAAISHKQSEWHNGYFIGVVKKH